MIFAAEPATKERTNQIEKDLQDTRTQVNANSNLSGGSLVMNAVIVVFVCLVKSKFEERRKGTEERLKQAEANLQLAATKADNDKAEWQSRLNEADRKVKEAADKLEREKKDLDAKHTAALAAAAEALKKSDDLRHGWVNLYFRDAIERNENLDAVVEKVNRHLGYTPKIRDPMIAALIEQPKQPSPAGQSPGEPPEDER